MKPTVLAGALLVVMVLVGAAPAAASQAQGAPPFKWWQSELYKKELGLTPEKSRRLEEIFQAAVPNQKALKKALDEADALFEKLVQQGDKKGAADQINRVIAARAELWKSHSLMLLEMRFELTAQQWTKLGVLQQQAAQKPPASEKSK